MSNFKNKKRFLNAATGMLLLLALVFAVNGCAQRATPPVAGSDTVAGNDAAATGDDLVIPLAGITEDASFYPVEVNGTQMEVIAVKAPDGTIRTAFNTCQICFDSGRGYYKQAGDELVCQNCGNRFPMSYVEVEAGGCNPWPIFQKNKTVSEDAITIPGDFLAESAKIFANWK